MDFPQIVKHKNIILKLYNWMDYPEDKPTRNVRAYDEKGNCLWVIAPLGGNSIADYYTNIASKNGKIHAFNFQAYDCIIDELTGEIISSSFTK